MATIVTRAGKGSPLTNTEVDTNFTNLNTAKVEVTGTPTTGQYIQYNGTNYVPSTVISGVSSVSGTAPVVSSGGATPAISMAAATTSVNGYLTSTDWNTFNNKTNNTGTVTSVSATAGTGISISGSPITTSGTLTITNTAPNQVVSLTASTGISVTGTYPNFTIASTVSGASITDDTTTNAVRYPLFEDITSGSLTTVNVSSTKFTFNPSTGTLTTTVHTSNSDERLKENWTQVAPDFLHKLAQVKHGIFSRKDNGNREAGVSAQSLQTVIPEAVVLGADGYLSVNYGGAALVAAIELAKEVQALRVEIAQLKAKVA